MIDKLLKIYLPGLICEVVAYAFKLLAAVALPIAAVWTAELHADRYVVQQQERRRGGGVLCSSRWSGDG